MHDTAALSNGVGTGVPASGLWARGGGGVSVEAEGEVGGGGALDPWSGRVE
jgi:hypothetical protein